MHLYIKIERTQVNYKSLCLAQQCRRQNTKDRSSSFRLGKEMRYLLEVDTSKSGPSKTRGAISEDPEDANDDSDDGDSDTKHPSDTEEIEDADSVGFMVKKHGRGDEATSSREQVGHVL